MWHIKNIVEKNNMIRDKSAKIKENIDRICAKGKKSKKDKAPKI